MLQICNNVIQSLYRDKINENEMLQKIDVYSLGMQIPFVFIQESLLHYLQTSNMVFDFFSLFGKMLDPSLDNRVSANEAYDLYNEIMKKYSRTTIPKKPRRSVSRGPRRVTKRRVTKRRVL